MANKIKMKTHSGAKKRFKVTGSGKVVHRGKGLRHILSNKSRKRKQGLKGNFVFDKANDGNLAKMMPNR